jgi:DNA helicase-2/ATP-dependent DNA helicase PcrA
MLSGLNESQRAAVEYIDGPSLVIAGAGSGKTRVLTYKIAYLISHAGIRPWEIMALTFTNKAAREMKERIALLVGADEARLLRMGTFHSIFSHILRIEAETLGYTRDFTIYDESDSKSLCRTVIKELQLDEKIYKPGDVLKRISAAKNNVSPTPSATPYRIVGYSDEETRNLSAIYAEYAQRCRKSNAMDFDDLLVNTYQLFEHHPEVLEKYRQQFRFILVDEYQDTNFIQQQILLQLVRDGNICVVGDDAQSIYAFRGARIDNILNFQKLFAGTRLFKLEQNYRSTQCIVRAANSLIHKNVKQIDKDVYSRNEEGDKLILRELSSDREEASFVIGDIKKKVDSGMSYDDFAILYRTNAQSRTFEEELRRNGIDFQIYGGMSFYQRKEIKDVVAYLRLIVNPNDEEAFKRIINYPARGIGNTTVNKIAADAREQGISMWDAAAAVPKCADFRNLISSFHERIYTDDAYTIGKDIIRQSGISQDVHSSMEPEYLSKQENLEEFVGSLQEFVETRREQGEPTDIVDFLKDVALLTDRDIEQEKPCVKLMTIHSAKGLEFPCVYIVGLEENIFPSPQSVDSMRKLEEERRLFYVAITRAEKHCIMTYAKMRYRYGKMEFSSPSRFLRDIDSDLLETGRPSSKNSLPPRRQPVSVVPSFRESRNLTPIRRQPSSFSPQPSDIIPHTSSISHHPSGGFSVGDAVVHERFGDGIVTAIEGSGDSQKAIVNFTYSGTKQLLLKFAKLKKK